MHSWIPGNIFKKKKSREQVTNQRLHFAVLRRFPKRYEDLHSRCFQLSERFWPFLSVSGVSFAFIQLGLVVTMNLLSWILTLRFNFIFYFLVSLRTSSLIHSLLSVSQCLSESCGGSHLSKSILVIWLSGMRHLNQSEISLHTIKAIMKSSSKRKLLRRSLFPVLTLLVLIQKHA